MEASESRQTQCEICDKILKIFSIEATQKVALGTVDNFLSAECTLHPRLVTVIGDDPPPTLKHVDGVYGFCHEEGFGIFGYDPVLKRYIYSRHLVLVSRERSRHHFLAGEIIGPELISTETFRKWKGRCGKEHGEQCRNSSIASGLPLPGLTWLIDISRKCLVPALPEMSYVALSYVWGEVPMYKTLKADLDRLQEPGALSWEDRCPPIPRTILDSMTVAELIEERYLWVDSLCITQDDEEARHMQIKNMGPIYANASLVVVAEHGDNANFGLRGIPGRDYKARTAFPERLELKQGWEVICKDILLGSEPYHSSWYKRGWTLQEHLFSSRRLVFGDHRVKWECSQTVWYDDIIEKDGSQNSLKRSASNSPSQSICHPLIRGREMFGIKYPNIDYYGSLVKNYNGRVLSYPEDALPAFSSITNVLSRAFAGGFICGLPALFFDVGLLWQGSSTLERRISRKMSSVGDFIPSWSWAGWRGELFGWSLLQSIDYLKNGSPESSALRTSRRVIPVLQWFIRCNDSPLPKPIQPSWCKYRSQYIAGDIDTPPGWARHAFISENEKSYDPRGYPERGAAPSCFYTHESDPEAEFWYPIPLVQSEGCISFNPVTSLITCRTLRTWLYLNEESDFEGAPYVTVQDGENRWAGILSLPQPLPITARFESGQRESCELVMLSRGYCAVELYCDESRDEDFQALYGSSDTYEYYNVLWIEWQGEVAYRKAVGRIDKTVWEREATEWIDLTLG